MVPPNCPKNIWCNKNLYRLDKVKPLATKTEAITNFKQPDNITELRRFIGMAQQIGKFSPKLAQGSLPL